MAEIYTWDISVSVPQEVTAVISSTNLVSSVTAGQTGISLGTVTALNDGTTGGQVNIKLYENPGTTEEYQLLSKSDNVNADNNRQFDISPVDTPSASGTWTLGIKVWGADESEPAWGTAGKTIIGTLAT